MNMTMATDTEERSLTGLGGKGDRRLLGDYFEYQRDPLALLYDRAAAAGGSVRLRLGHKHIHLFVTPEHINQVLLTNVEKYEKGIGYKSLNYMLGPGLLTSNGDLWKRQRALTKPVFSRRYIDNEVSLMVECGEQMVDRVNRHCGHDEVFDLVPEVLLYAGDSLSRAIMGNEVQGVLPEIHDHVNLGRQWVMRHTGSLIQLPPSVPTPANRRFQRVVAHLHSVVEQVIDAHRQSPDGHKNLLDRLFLARDDDGHAMDGEQLRHEVLTFLLGGHKTTGGAIAWTLYELCRNEQTMRDVVDEIDSVLRGDPPNADTISAMELTGRAIDESLRLHPSIWAFTRRALAADTFEDFDLPEGSQIVISPFVNHRLPQFWDSPLRFDPERFNQAAVRARPSFHYFPFGWGPRLCIGHQLARVEIKVALAMLLSRFEFELINGMRVRENPEVSNMPDPILVRARLRSRPDRHSCGPVIHDEIRSAEFHAPHGD